MMALMPKVELHAHLNGSVSTKTLSRMIKSRRGDTGMMLAAHIDDGNTETLEECFKMFKLVHEIVNDHHSLYEATSDVIDEFADDGVVYLELRSTPRPVPEANMTQISYVETVLRAISDKTSSIEQLKHYNPSKKPIIVRYVAAIDRRNSIKHAEETVDIAIDMMKRTGLVVGVDLSGDGTVNDARSFYPVLQRASDNNLKLTLHLAEVDGLVEETLEMLNLPPHRIGHGTFIHPKYGGTEALLDKTLKLKVPLELCPTSNVKGQVVPSYEAHHFGPWYELKHPVVICTDDKGVFSTNLSEEYKHVLNAFQLTQQQVEDLAYDSISHIFEADDIKDCIRDYFRQWQRYSTEIK